MLGQSFWNKSFAWRCRNLWLGYLFSKFVFVYFTCFGCENIFFKFWYKIWLNSIKVNPYIEIMVDEIKSVRESKAEIFFQTSSPDDVFYNPGNYQFYIINSVCKCLHKDKDKN